MYYENTFSSPESEEKQIYFLSKILSSRRKCTGVQNCKALQDAGLTPPPYYLTSSSTDVASADWEKEKKIAEKVAQYYKSKELNKKVSKRKPDTSKNKKYQKHILKINNLPKYNIHVPKDVYVYKKKHLVKEVRFPKQIVTSVTRLHSPIKDYASYNKKDRVKHKKLDTYKNDKRQHICKCLKQTMKKNKDTIDISKYNQPIKSKLIEPRTKRKKDAFHITEYEQPISSNLIEPRTKRKKDAFYIKEYEEPITYNLMEHEAKNKKNADKNIKYEHNLLDTLEHEANNKNNTYKKSKCQHICQCSENNVGEKQNVIYMNTEHEPDILDWLEHEGKKIKKTYKIIKHEHLCQCSDYKGEGKRDSYIPTKHEFNILSRLDYDGKKKTDAHRNAKYKHICKCPEHKNQEQRDSNQSSKKEPNILDWLEHGGKKIKKTYNSKKHEHVCKCSKYEGEGQKNSNKSNKHEFVGWNWLENEGKKIKKMYKNTKHTLNELDSSESEDKGKRKTYETNKHGHTSKYSENKTEEQKDIDKNTKHKSDIFRWLEHEGKKLKETYKTTKHGHLCKCSEHKGEEQKDLKKSNKHKSDILNWLENEGKKIKKTYKTSKHEHICKCSEHKEKQQNVELEALQISSKAASDAKRLVAGYKSAHAKSEPIKCMCEVDLRVNKNKKEKNVKQKTKAFLYHDLMEKLKIEDIPPEGKQKENKGMHDAHDAEIKSKLFFGDSCRKGPCTKAAKDKNYKFICKCSEKKKPDITECSNEICNVTSTSTVEKIKRKIISMCHKYSEIFKKPKIVPTEANYIDRHICDVGPCRSAFDSKNENFLCKCVKMAAECSDADCGVPKKNKPSTNTLKHSKRHRKDSTKDQSQEKRNAFDQTGEPFFELKVSSVDMSALNSDEIRNKVESLGKAQKKHKTCICPSRARGDNNFLPKATCATGICKKAYKNKKTDFKCKCAAEEGRVCTDLTCERHINNVSSFMSDPLFEVKFNAKDMRIVNMDEVRNRISDIRAQMGDVCSAGVCRDAADNKGDYICKCKLKKIKQDIRECTENICRKRNIGWDTALKSTKSFISSKMPKDLKAISNDMIVDNDLNIDIEKKRKRIFSKSSKNIRRNNIHRRNGLSIPSIMPNKSEDSNSFLKCKHILSRSCSALLKRIECRRHKFKRSGLNIPFSIHEMKNLKKSHVNGDACVCCICGISGKDCKCNPQTTTQNEALLDRPINHKTKATKVKPSLRVDDKTPTNYVQAHKKSKNVCMCDYNENHICECGLMIEKEKQKQKKFATLSRSQRLKQKRHKKKKDTQKIKIDANMSIKRRKEFIREQKQFQKELKKKAKIEKKKKDKLLKLQKKELEAISAGKEEAQETSCFADFCLGILKICVILIRGIIFVLFKSLAEPKNTYQYVKLKLMDPVGTFLRVYQYIADGWRLKKLQMLKSISGSEKMKVLIDTFEDTPVFQAFADKGTTPKEKRAVALKNKQRKIRMTKRTEDAYRNCGQSLLHTLRKTPCLWIYHICPYFYPHCLYIITFMKNISDILLFMVAFVFWTPCIVCCETCRALCCCILCTN